MAPPDHGVLYQIELGHMFAVASLTFFLYDIVLTFSQEVSLIHKDPRWNLVKILYLLNRYYILIILLFHVSSLFVKGPSDQFCKNATRLSMVGSWLGKFIPDVWLVFRVYAVWRSNHKVFVFLGAVLLINLCIGGVILSRPLYSLYQLKVSGRLPDSLNKGCFFTPEHKNFWIIYVGNIVFEATVVGLTMWKTVRYFRGGDFMEYDTPLLRHLYCTTLIYFGVMSIAMTFMSLTKLIFPVYRIAFKSQFIMAFISTVCARMMLSIRTVTKEMNYYSAATPSDMHVPGFQLTPLPAIGSPRNASTLVQGQTGSPSMALS